MFNVLVIDDSFLKIEDYEEAFKNYRDVKIIDKLNGLKIIDDVLKQNKIDLISFNIQFPVKKDVKKIKLISEKNKIPLIFSGKIDKDSRKFSFVEKKSTMVKSYIYKKRESKRTEKSSLVIIGSSTGGPRALQEIIPKLPNDLNAIVLIVQHMPAVFTASLADRLNMTSAINVKEAEDNEKLLSSHAYIAPGDFHMEIKRNRNGYIVDLNQKDKIKGLRPAVDVLMKSAAKDNNYDKMGIILTGMGTDGAEGVIDMKKAGSYNIIQDEDSCVIYGMPRAAYDTKCIDEIVKLDEIAEKILLRVGCKNGFRY